MKELNENSLESDKIKELEYKAQMYDLFLKEREREERLIKDYEENYRKVEERQEVIVNVLLILFLYHIFVYSLMIVLAIIFKLLEWESATYFYENITSPWRYFLNR